MRGHAIIVCIIFNDNYYLFLQEANSFVVQPRGQFQPLQLFISQFCLFGANLYFATASNHLAMILFYTVSYHYAPLPNCEKITFLIIFSWQKQVLLNSLSKLTELLR